MPQDGAPSSIDVLAAQVRDALHWDHVRRPDRAQALLALRALVARAKEAEERAEAHLLLRKEAASWAEEVEAERDALVARVTEVERERDEWVAMHQELARQEFVGDPAADARVRKAEAALADARNALERIANEPDLMRPRRLAREVLARLDGEQR